MNKKKEFKAEEMEERLEMLTLGWKQHHAGESQEEFGPGAVFRF